jgi:Glycosyl hydrolases family 2, TIM barrel domain/Glycoside hydrolase family 2 C-terminal domain 5/Domain of unknown function (DUF4982)/Glycosyl hydrolases family 2, sugar binding domain/Glycosyl hydrolases family 2
MMHTSLFTADWTFRRDADTGDTAEHPVRLPHDAMLVEGRAADAPSGAHGSHFLGGRYVYAKRWTAPADFCDRHFSLLFEGVQGLTRVLVNGTDVGGSVNGYAEFEVNLDSSLTDGENLIEVRVDNSAQPNSRWYTGSGIYRPVWLLERGNSFFARDGMRFVPTIDGDVVELGVDFDVEGSALPGAEVRLELWDADKRVANGVTQAREGRVRLVVPEARLWSAETPHLYRAEVQLVAGGTVLDRESPRIGLRTVDVRAGEGLLINGVPTLLKGACIHHDNGILGAATFRAAEFRRARILKDNGYNAVRSSHNPLSRDMLDACDELGLYVMDELTDVWTSKKTAHDGSQYFQDHWRDDLRSMIAKDRNHASVIMYSIGNEIPDTATAAGVELTGELSRFARQLDPTRPVTEAINFLLNVMAGFNKSPFDTSGEQEGLTHKKERKQPKPTSTAANAITNRIGSIMHLISRLPQADKLSRGSFAQVDVAGYNYAGSRYQVDAKRYPERVIVGSETMPGDIAKNWAKVNKLPNVVGDFVWTGWDYLGEAGIGNWNYGKGAAAMNRPYPHVVAGAGAIDITGVPGAATLLSRAVWGELSAPGIAVRPLDHSGKPVARSAWRSTDAIQSWSWRGKDGTKAEIEVYSDAEQVELLLNGRSLGRKRAGRRHGFLARFCTAYQPGELVAVARRHGLEHRTVLRSAAAELRLALTADRIRLEASGDDLAFLRIEVADNDGVIEMLADDQVRLEVAGAGTLAGFGSAAPVTVDSYLGNVTDTYYGRALAVIRSGVHPGTITVTATSARYGTATLELDVAEPALSALNQ